ncbi:mitochondrial fission factor-like isoform X2 [Alosa alosa]|uniref:mitochondrial fission factor-like isoform X2 n=1 Tax=Alosa alosa TaxID=278164 RepID=UPI0020155109|nr:mitochondrial fission factor-like isoform X2 [Alosa alosa]
MAAQMFDYAPGRTSSQHPSEANWSTYSEGINQRMRVPERIRVAPGTLAEEEQKPEDVHPAYTMHIPDKLALTAVCLADVPDLSARPMFSKHSSGHASSVWDLGAFSVDAAHLQHSAQSPIRRSYSDQAFGRSPPVTPTRTKEALQSPPSRCSGRALAPSQRGSATVDPPAATPQALALGSLPPNLLSPQGVLQAAKELGQQASQRLLQTVAQKYSSRFGIPENHSRSSAEVQPYTETRKSALQEPWLSPEEESGAAVEFIVLRRQLLKMSRRLAALERQNVEHKQAEMLLFSLMVSAVLLNGWLWMRR